MESYGINIESWEHTGNEQDLMNTKNKHMRNQEQKVPWFGRGAERVAERGKGWSVSFSSAAASHGSARFPCRRSTFLSFFLSFTSTSTSTALFVTYILFPFYFHTMAPPEEPRKREASGTSNAYIDTEHFLVFLLFFFIFHFLFIYTYIYFIVSYYHSFYRQGATNKGKVFSLIISPLILIFQPKNNTKTNILNTPLPLGRESRFRRKVETQQGGEISLC